VVLEIVERSVVAGDVPIIDEDFLALLEQALATAPPAPAP
jgi:molybdopterin-guanine dinucleotide biosynthesis protein A